MKWFQLWDWCWCLFVGNFLFTWRSQWCWTGALWQKRSVGAADWCRWSRDYAEAAADGWLSGCSEFHPVSFHMSSCRLNWRKGCSTGMSKFVWLCWKVNSIYGGKPYQLPRCFLSKNIRMSQTGLVHVCRARTWTDNKFKPSLVLAAKCSRRSDDPIPQGKVLGCFWGTCSTFSTANA